MFGFLHGPQHHRGYRQLYAQCCSTLRDQCGYRSLPFVSYEAIFACALAIDKNLVAPPPENGATCCRTSKKHSFLTQHHTQSQRVLGEYFASFATLLAWVKLTDDVQDSGSMVAKLGRPLLRKSYQASLEFFHSFDADFQSKLESCLNRHAEFERRGAPMDLDRYTGPTADAFALVYQLLPIAIAARSNASVDQSERDWQSEKEWFASAGRLVGQSLIAFDCAVDFHRDRRQGHYNPLGITHTVLDAFDYSQRKLIELGWQFSTQSTDAICPAILRHRVKTISMRRQQWISGSNAPRENRLGGATRASSWRLPQLWFRPRQLQRGICDCDCACEGCVECFSGAGHAADFCGGPSCGCECCADMCCAGVCDSPNKQQSKETGVTESSAMTDRGRDTVTLVGEVTVALTPYGTVKIVGEDGVEREEPAKSDSGAIEVGEKIAVIRKEAFGLLVRRIAKKTSSQSEPTP